MILKRINIFLNEDKVLEYIELHVCKRLLFVITSLINVFFKKMVIR